LILNSLLDFTMLRFVVLLVASVAYASAARSSTYIVGGSPAVDGQWPFVAGLKLDGQFRCGTALIHTNWTITSYHCVTGATGAWSVEFGSVTRGDGIDIPVDSVVLNPDYGVGTGAYPNDLAVIRLSTPADTTNPNINTINFGATGTDWTALNCYTIGWGKNCSTCNYPTVLQQLNIAVISDETGEQRWKDSYNNVTHVGVWDALYQDKIPCRGDEGTPLTCVNDESEWVLVGTGSWGDAVCSPAQPFLYTLVEEYKEWICTATDGDVCPS